MFIKHQLGACLALVCLALVVLIPAFAEPGAHAQSADKGEDAGQDQRGGKDFTPIPGAMHNQSKPAIYLPDCTQPKDHNEADLCEQMRMADAAKEAVRVGYWQVGVGIGAVVAGSLAALFAGWAAWAASVSAKASQRSAEVSERALRGLERPYLLIRVDDAYLHSMVTGKDGFSRSTLKKRPTVGFHFTNYGRLPAVLSTLCIDFDHLSKLPDEIRHIPNITLYSDDAIEPGKQTRKFSRHIGYDLSDAALDSIAKGRSFIWLCGLLVIAHPSASV